MEGGIKRRKAAILRGRSAAKQCNAMLASPAVKSAGVGLLSGRKTRRKEKKKIIRKYSGILCATVNGGEQTIAIPPSD